MISIRRTLLPAAAASALALALVACSFDGTGLGGDAGSNESTTTTTTSSGGEATGPTTTGPGTSGSASDSTSVGTTSVGTTTVDPTTTTTTTTTTAATTMTTTGPICGDGAIDPGEECDNGPLNGDDQTCKSDCVVNTCGDGAQGPGEGCDDGNNVDRDGCSATCVLETCGDGVVDPGEACDDGDDDDTDECTGTCTAASCGDGFIQKSNSEACDDGPGNGGDAPCTPECQDNVCGDGFPLAGVEACDDGNTVDGDACTNKCSAAVCGDGVVQEGVEECDDGDEDDMDACSNLCVSQGTRVFVTAAVFDGALGGLSGAHGKCQAAADAESLGGTWKAWIATGAFGEAPVDFLAPSPEPYVRIDGVVVALDWGDLTDGTLAAKIDVTEAGVNAGGSGEVWTNVAIDGTSSGSLATCVDWMSNLGGVQGNVGLRANTDSKWTDHDPKNCNGAKHLYCFEE